MKQTSLAVFYFLIGTLLCLSSAYAQQDFNRDEVRTALVGHIVNHIGWQEKARQEQINLLVYKDDQAYQSLKLLADIKLQNKAVNVGLIEELNSDKSAHLVYVSQQYAQAVSQITSHYRSSNTLIITENSPTLHNIMINIIEDEVTPGQTAKYKFQINRPNLTFENLSILPDLVLYGGSELDVAELYRQTEQAIEAMREQNTQISSRLQTTQQSLQDKELQLAKLESKLSQRAQQLTQQEQNLLSKEQEYQLLSVKVGEVNQSYLDSIALIEQKEQELKIARADFAAQQTGIQQQQQILDKLKADIADNEQRLAQQSSQLQLSKQEVESQAKTIEQKNTVITVVSGLIVLAIFGGSAIWLLLLRIRRINQKLKRTVSHLESTQTQLVESEKMASLGQLVAGVAHELNTPLGISLTAVSTMGGDAQKLEELVEQAKLRKSDLTDYITKAKELDYLVRHNLERCHKLIQSFKQVSSDQIVAEIRPIHLQEYIGEVMQTLSVLLDKHDVSWQIKGDNPLISIDPGVLSQILNNLTTNAITHAFDGINHKKINILIQQSGDKTNITFSDNGKGMDEEVRSNIFEPFFTTKRGQGGVGLGMNIVFNLVTAKLSGDISIASEVGQGSHFTISLPA